VSEIASAKRRLTALPSADAKESSAPRQFDGSSSADEIP